MANISTAKGTMYLSRKFYDKNKELINNYVKCYQDQQIYEYYGFVYMKIEKVTENKICLTFVGEGRWRWEKTLKTLFSTDEDRSQINPYRDDLIKRLYEDKEEIKMKYQDYEPGCEILTEKKVRINVKKYDNKEKFYTEVIVDKDVDIDYTDYNRIKTGVEDGYLLDENKEGLIKALKDYYNENKDIIKAKDFNLFKEYVLTYVENDSELKGGLCTYRLMDDPETFLEIMETSLEN